MGAAVDDEERFGEVLGYGLEGLVRDQDGEVVENWE